LSALPPLLNTKMLQCVSMTASTGCSAAFEIGTKVGSGPLVSIYDRSGLHPIPKNIKSEKLGQKFGDMWYYLWYLHVVDNYYLVRSVFYVIYSPDCLSATTIQYNIYKSSNYALIKYPILSQRC